MKFHNLNQGVYGIKIKERKISLPLKLNGSYQITYLQMNEKVSNYTLAKKIWDPVEVTQIGTTQMNASKVHTLVSQYELFKMKEGQSSRI